MGATEEMKQSKSSGLFCKILLSGRLMRGVAAVSSILLFLKRYLTYGKYVVWGSRRPFWKGKERYAELKGRSESGKEGLGLARDHVDLIIV